MIKCILFDRDGTLGELSDLRFPQTFQPFTNINAVFQAIREKGYLVGIITNQSSIARGTAVGYDYEKEFKSYGVDAFAICPHDNQDHCDCRKPKSGLLLQVCKTLRISPTECLVVGDRMSDILCAERVGAKAMLVLTGYGEKEKEEILKNFPQLPIITRFDEVLSLL